MKTTILIAALSLARTTSAQDLHRAVASADLVVVATDARVRPLGKELLLHRLDVAATLRGDAADHVTVVEHRNLSAHLRPRPGERRLYCLVDFSAKAAALGLPARQAPYYKMCGHRGSNPAVGDPSSDPWVELTRAVLASENGATPAEHVAALLRLALTGPREMRTEAVTALTVNRRLHPALGREERSRLLSRAVAETDDVPFKIALASLCAEVRMDGLVDALCGSVDDVADPRFAETLGRIARRLHGERAIDVLRPHLVKATGSPSHARLLRALGATSTERALDALLQMHSAGGSELPEIEQALGLHGSPRALRVVRGKRPGSAK
jgi:hypothetical protein